MIHSNNNLKAIFLILVGMSVFAIQDTFIKLISNDVNLYLIYFIRCIIGLSVILLYLKLNKIKIIFITHYPVLTIIRTTAFFLGFSFYYFSLSKLSLPIAITLFFVSPFFTSIFSMLILNEYVGYKRWSAIFVGFIGVFLVMDPDFNDFNIYSLFPVICAVCYSFTIIIQKKTSDKDSVFSQIIHIYISALIFSILIKFSLSNIIIDPVIVEEYRPIFIDWKVDNILNLLMLIAIGFTGVIGFFCLFSAYNIGSPSAIAPFEYVIIIWGLVIGWFLWSETLNLKGFIGLFLIVSAGIFTFLREANLNKKISLDKPMR